MFYGIFRAGPGAASRRPEAVPVGLLGGVWVAVGSRKVPVGAWGIPAGMPNGTFYAVAKQRPIETPAKTLVCKRAAPPGIAF